MPKILAPGELQRRRDGIAGLLAPYNVPASGTEFLVRNRFTPEKVGARLEAMGRAGFPLRRRGILETLAQGEPGFRARLKRYTAMGGLTRNQAVLQKLLERKGVSQEVINALVGRHAVLPKTVYEKIKFFESIQLDPAVYGVERIPVHIYEKRLGMKPWAIKRKMKEFVLWPLEDEHAAKQLDKEWPGWRHSRKLAHVAIRTANILKRVMAAKAKGLQLTAKLIGDYSVEAIAAGRVLLPTKRQRMAYLRAKTKRRRRRRAKH